MTSKSDRGLSTLTVSIQGPVRQGTRLPQVWDELRRKVGDAQRNLPPGAGPSLVIDDFGDVYGVFVAVYGAEYSYAELKDFVELLRRELLLVQDVAKIELLGERTEAIYVEPSRDRMSQLGHVPMERDRRAASPQRWWPTPGGSRWGPSSSPSSRVAVRLRRATSRTCGSAQGRAVPRSGCGTSRRYGAATRAAGQDLRYDGQRRHRSRHFDGLGRQRGDDGRGS